MLLGFVVSKCGIKANPKKISAIANVVPIQNLKGVQKLMGCLASLNRFISRLVSPSEKEPLLLYVMMTNQVVSAAIVVERQEEGHALPVQRPVYFISEVLFEAKTQYP
jgi:hypothetical protein